MQITPVDYMPVSRTQSDTSEKNQEVSLYLDEEEFKKVKKETGCAGYFSMTDFQLPGYRSNFNFNLSNLVNNPKSQVALNYDDHNKDRGFKTLVGWIVDTLA